MNEMSFNMESFARSVCMGPKKEMEMDTIYPALVLYSDDGGKTVHESDPLICGESVFLLANAKDGADYSELFKSKDRGDIKPVLIPVVHAFAAPALLAACKAALSLMSLTKAMNDKCGAIFDNVMDELEAAVKLGGAK